MKTNTSEAKKATENKKRGTLRGHLEQVTPLEKMEPDQVVDQVTPFPGTNEDEPESNRAAKSEVAYWRDRVRPRVLRDGTPTAEFYMRLKAGGRDTWVCLDTGNRETAAKKARDLWLAVRSKGLDAALAEFRPQADPMPAKACTVGEYLAAARAVSTTRPRTFAQYKTKLRTIVAGVMKVGAPVERYAAGSEANKAWRAKIDSIRLDRITPSEVKAWQKRQEDAAPNVIARQKREHSIASHIRNARSLFSEEILSEARKTLTLPAELPFAGITVASTTRRFKNPVDPRALYAASSGLDADTRAAFILLLIGGLRRGEADLLPWSNVDLKAGTVGVSVTEWLAPKTEESARVVPLPADVVEFLKKLRADAPGDEFVLKGGPARAPGTRYEYRANAWQPLTAWLRKQGVNDLNPLHSLRKMSGSLVYSTAGIEAARRHLGHRTIATTAASYLAGSAATVDLATP